MPLGFERLNERTQRPNPHINFLRPLPGPTSPTALSILSRIAAICTPIMKSQTILVQALEEFPYNIEFVGRNFNAGEVIQLVLRDRRGNWLPQRMVEMVMIHELAHCREMNHSKAFWRVRDEYAAELRALWARGYTGEGMWGRGRAVDSGVVQRSEVAVGDVPEHLCGGTYGRPGRKRRRGRRETEALSYAERKQKRILKKFGDGGQALGEDIEAKVKLEKGQVKKGKPRVAGSARGRELRAAAALARFDNTKKEELVIVKEEIVSSESETEDEGDEDNAIVDVDGKRLVDDKGRILLKICDDEVESEGDAQRERDELRNFAKGILTIKPNNRTSLSKPDQIQMSTDTSSSKAAPHPSSANVTHLDEIRKRRPNNSPKSSIPTAPSPTIPPMKVCLICSLDNEFTALTCAACSNVLNPDLMPGNWRCHGTICKGSEYINPGDAERCGVCGIVREHG